jgi:hypothetical protein
MLQLVRKTRSSAPPACSILEPLLTEPYTLATLAAASAVCDHPAASHVSLDVTVGPEQGRLTWCAFCGAMAHTLQGEPLSADDWHRSALVKLLSAEQLGELANAAGRAAHLADAARSLCDLATEQGDKRRLGSVTGALALVAMSADKLAHSPAFVGSARLAAATERLAADPAAGGTLSGWFW